jgi:hypothetical protein
MLKYVMITSGLISRSIQMPRRASAGDRRPAGAAVFSSSPGEPTSSWPLRKASHCGCVSLITAYSMRSTSGSRRPRSARQAATLRSSPSGGCAS